MSEGTKKEPNQAGWAAQYGVAALSVVLAFLLRSGLQPFLDGFPYTTFYIAVVATAWYAGLGPAVFCALAGGVAAEYVFVPPRFSFSIHHPSHLLWLAFYALTAGSIIVAMEARSRAQRRAAGSARLAAARLKKIEEQIGRREEAERERDRLRRWSAQTLASIGDGVITTDTEACVTFLNEVACDLTGWTLDEAKGQPVERVFNISNERTGQPVDSPVNRVLREGVVVGLANHTILTSKSGSALPIDDSGAPIRDDDGRILGAVLVFRDFTERRRAEEAAAQLAAIVQSSQDAIFSRSLDGTILTWNEGAERVFGYSASEVLGRTVSLLIPPERMAEVNAMREAIREGRRLEPFETTRVRKDGKQIQVSLSVSPIYDSEGDVVAASHIARDITAQKEFESLLLQSQKLESLGILAGGIAHDFNNLLTGVIASCSFALEFMDKSSTEATAVEQALRAGERAAHLTAQMLAYSGKGKFLIQHVDASRAVREIVALLGASIPRNVELQFDLREDLPDIEVDVAQFQQLVMNLVINGAEAIGEAAGSVTISTGVMRVGAPDIASKTAFRDLKAGDYVRLRVLDTGCGMDSSTLTRIFDPFFTTKFTGRGLGLAAALGIIRAHGGAVDVESTPGTGTLFTVLIPVGAPAARKAEEPPHEARPDTGVRGTVLVIDDEELVRQTARMALERVGYQVIVAENGRAGVEQFRLWAGRLTTVLLDLTMPVMSGSETLERLQAIHPGVPVIMSSGYNEAEVNRRCQGRRIFGFLQKPFTAPVLVAKVKAASSSE